MEFIIEFLIIFFIVIGINQIAKDNGFYLFNEQSKHSNYSPLKAFLKGFMPIIIIGIFLVIFNYDNIIEWNEAHQQQVLKNTEAWENESKAWDENYAYHNSYDEVGRARYEKEHPEQVASERRKKANKDAAHKAYIRQTEAKFATENRKTR